jgi:small subunit ribosomal protein S20
VANHPQAKKRTRQRIKRTARNRHFRTSVRTLVKQVRAAVEAGDAQSAGESLKLATRQLDRAVTKGVLKRKTASRTISRLSQAVNKIGKPASA